MDSSFHININKHAVHKVLFFIISRIYFSIDILPLIIEENGIIVKDNLRMKHISFINLEIIEDLMIIVLSHGIISDITDKKRRHSTMKRTIKASFYK